MDNNLVFIDIAFENVEVVRIPIGLVELFSTEFSKEYHIFDTWTRKLKKAYCPTEIELVLRKSAKEINSANGNESLESLLEWNGISSIILVYADGSFIEYDAPYFGIEWYYNNHLEKVKYDDNYINISIGKRFVKFPILGYLKDLLRAKIVSPIKEWKRKRAYEKEIRSNTLL